MVEALTIRRARRRPAAARAFTLVEMLVVIAIVLLLMGLSVASVVRGPKLQRMVAAEQVIADCIRQARHTARTSGQPVVLKLKKGDEAVGGLVRTVLWHGVEGPEQGTTWPQTEEETAPGAWQRFDGPGRTGLGLQLPGAYTTSGAVDAPRADWSTQARLAAGRRLWRGIAPAAPEDRPALLLSVAVRPPLATAGAPQVLPLAMVADSAAGVAAYDSAPLGLALVLSTSAPTTGPRTSTAAQKTVPTWEIVGWFGTANRLEVSSIAQADRPKDQADQGLVGHEDKVITEIDSGASVSQSREYSEAGALVGGRWTEIALLVENDRLVLYRDGRRVGERSGALAREVPAGVAEQVYVGIATLAAGDPPVLADGATIDDVRIERLGDALAGTLPGGVVPDADRRIICHPDGRVEVDANSGTEDPTVIVLSSDSGERAELTIATSGAVASLTAAAP